MGTLSRGIGRRMRSSSRAASYANKENVGRLRGNRAASTPPTPCGSADPNENTPRTSHSMAGESATPAEACSPAMVASSTSQSRAPSPTAAGRTSAAALSSARRSTGAPASTPAAGHEANVTPHCSICSSNTPRRTVARSPPIMST